MPPKSPEGNRAPAGSRRLAEVVLTGAHRVGETTCTRIKQGNPDDRHHTSNTFLAKTLVLLGREIVVNGEWYIPAASGAVFSWRFA